MKPLYKVSGSLCTLKDSQEIPNQPADLSLCAGRGGPLPGVILCASLKDLIIAVSYLLLGGADEVWCQARGLNWAALCQARKLRAELVELMQQIELPLSQPAFGSEQNRRDLQKALLSGFFLKVGEGAEWNLIERKGALPHVVVHISNPSTPEAGRAL